MSKKKIAFVLGVRPDIIRASLILEHLKKNKRIETTFIWSGQHYSDNLKGVFLRELNVDPPVVELGCGGETDTDILGNLLIKLYKTLEKLRPDAAVFLGDTNTVAGCIAPALLNIPIVHIEGGMRSYDWRMPEEKYRVVIDHLADVIYVYFDEYKRQAINEGVNPDNIVVVGNPIVDVLNKFFFKRQKIFADMASDSFFSKRNLTRGNYYLMTWHRRENVYIDKAFWSIVNFVNEAPYPVYFPASYRTQRVLKQQKVKWSKQVKMVDPIGYGEFLTLTVNSRGVLTDSGTVVEEACILNIPSVQMRKSTERPQVYDAGGSVKLDPLKPQKYPSTLVYKKLDSLYGKKWKHNLGDGKASIRIAKDLVSRVLNDNLRGYLPEKYHIPIDRSYKEDEIRV